MGEPFGRNFNPWGRLLNKPMLKYPWTVRGGGGGVLKVRIDLRLILK